jgi:cobyrinic acid a,c-diamide synthase
MPSAFLLAAPYSGAGKTTLTLTLLAAFGARGLRVQPFKVGPDYIDPSHHAHLAGRTSHNLDTWMLSPEANRRIFSTAAQGVDVALVEGVMGLFDGVDGKRPDGSSAHLAQLLGLPVVLVVDARAMARSAAALVHGFASFDPDVRLAGVIWNRVGSDSHRRILDEALAQASLPPSFGALPRNSAIALPERHLGLVTAEDAPLPGETARTLAGFAEEHLDLDALLRATVQGVGDRVPPATRRGQSETTRRIGIPRDQAFCFYYEENLRLLREAGAELVHFRPTDGDSVPPALDGLYLGGGYPELHARRLSRNNAFLDGLRALQAAGAPIYAECGGFMVLCQALEDLHGNTYPMAGVFPTVARMRGKRFRLGYREVEISGIPGLDGLRARGHEFHYSHVEMPLEVGRVYHAWNARGEPLPDEGYRAGKTLGGYVHLHFASNPAFPARFFGLG